MQDVNIGGAWDVSGGRGPIKEMLPHACVAAVCRTRYPPCLPTPSATRPPAPRLPPACLPASPRLPPALPNFQHPSHPTKHHRRHKHRNRHRHHHNPLPAPPLPSPLNGRMWVGFLMMLGCILWARACTPFQLLQVLDSILHSPSSIVHPHLECGVGGGGAAQQRHTQVRYIVAANLALRARWGVEWCGAGG